MATINVYQQCFQAQASFNGTERHAALVLIIADSEAGRIQYQIAVSFFPHNDPEDFAISYDAYFCRTVYQAKGRRSKKREAEYFKILKETVDALSDGVVIWEEPITDARYA